MSYQKYLSCTRELHSPINTQENEFILKSLLGKNLNPDCLARELYQHFKKK
jgi:hypothetical protein